MRTVHVDELGRDKDGNEYGHVASDDAVKEGLCVNEPVRLRYPDGYTTVTNEVRITEKGLAKIASDMTAGRA